MIHLLTYIPGRAQAAAFEYATTPAEVIAEGASALSYYQRKMQIGRWHTKALRLESADIADGRAVAVAVYGPCDAVLGCVVHRCGGARGHSARVQSPDCPRRAGSRPGCRSMPPAADRCCSASRWRSPTARRAVFKVVAAVGDGADAVAASFVAGDESVGKGHAAPAPTATLCTPPLLPDGPAPALPLRSGSSTAAKEGAVDDSQGAAVGVDVVAAVGIVVGEGAVGNRRVLLREDAAAGPGCVADEGAVSDGDGDRAVVDAAAAAGVVGGEDAAGDDQDAHAKDGAAVRAGVVLHKADVRHPRLELWTPPPSAPELLYEKVLSAIVRSPELRMPPPSPPTLFSTKALLATTDRAGVEDAARLAARVVFNEDTVSDRQAAGSLKMPPASPTELVVRDGAAGNGEHGAVAADAAAAAVAVGQCDAGEVHPVGAGHVQDTVRPVGVDDCGGITTPCQGDVAGDVQVAGRRCVFARAGQRQRICPSGEADGVIAGQRVRFLNGGARGPYVVSRGAPSPARHPPRRWCR